MDDDEDKGSWAGESGDSSTTSKKSSQWSIAFGGFLEEFEEDDIENIEEWTEELRACAESATKTVPEEANMLTADSKLLHMWEAKSSMQRRLRIQRHNRQVKTLKEEEGVAYVDAAEYKGRGAMAAVVVNGDGHLVASCSVKTDDPETAEEHARRQDNRVRLAERGSQLRQRERSPKTLRVLRGATCFGGRERVRLVWTPAHASLPGNEEAHDAARGLTVRAGTTSGAPVASSGRDRLVTFRGILDHYTDGRRRFPPAHHSLNKRQSTVWRRLQTNTYPCPALLNRWYPDRYTGACKLCGQRANLKHMVWECNNINRGACANKLLTQLRDEESWETTLLSSEPRVQEDLVRLAEDAAGVQGILAVV
ncbi:hypothetical protein HPB47_019839 [Ixodes persulcatus]|uniref:Uncharacterized protein n=1 Tax=Ixodes persulcatus TaxID=34615 RepID=A0AC60QH27_IXOPE|nr:hypothetical protein HPB47_019839 [Ixodes persulcatus]